MLFLTKISQENVDLFTEMDVKIECERVFTLCHGCLSPGRKISYLTGENKAFFLKLRDDYTIQEATKDMLLCWECMALLKKVKSFQSRIQTAQYMIDEYLHTVYNKENTLQSLSSLHQTPTVYYYNEEYVYNDLTEKENKLTTPSCTENKQKIETPEEKQITEIIPETLLSKIKQENEEIKAEYEDSNDTDYFDNDTDFFDSTFRIENSDVKIVPPKKKAKKKNILKRQSIKFYKEYATVSLKNAKFKNITGHFEMVYLGERAMQERARIIQNNFGFNRLPFKCTNCKLGYKWTNQLLMHKAFHHSKPEFPTTCLACNKELVSEEDKSDHWQIHCPMFKCNYCSELSVSKGEMLKHLNRSHTKIFKCSSCFAEAGTLQDFAKHYKKMHERFFCDYCDQGYSTKKKLEKHIRNNHLPHNCTICNTSYATFHLLNRHNRNYHPELASCDTRKELAYCVECDKQFPSIEKYKKHLKDSSKHTPKEKLSLPCPECNKVFTRRIYLNNHYKLFHLKNTKHYCELCNKYFANGYGVRKHIKRVHQKEPPPKDKYCDICGRGFSARRILENHRRTHTGERPFQCSYCPASFAQDAARKSHEKSQHKHVLDSQS